jgi:leucyl-tRNA---protein transferase
MTPPFINEAFTCDAVPPAVMDALWAAGWRHFGADFFRYSLQMDEQGALQTIQPLRLDVADFSASKSQRRVLNRNADIEWEIIPARADAEVQRLFHLHRERFTSNIPDSIFSFLATERPDSVPCECLEFRALLEGRLVAVSYLDVGAEATSSVYGLFDPEFARRSPGILTLLKEIEWSRENGKRLLYPGYATREASHYDYKKQFAPLSALDWISGEWLPLSSS